jgi:hypothetical protein
VSVAVVHLASASLGAEPFRAFLDAYAQYPAGLEHELVVVYNGFADGDASMRADLPHRDLYLAPRAIDLVAYRRAAEQLDHDVLCLINSTTEPLADGWLAKLVGALGEGVGAAGATGTWESHLTQHEREMRRERGWSPRDVAARVAMRVQRPRLVRRFAPFPSPHLRTTGLALRRDVMLDIWPSELGGKLDAHAFESGRDGLAARLQRRGLEERVVGRDGVAYPPDRWPESATFRAGGQANLLLADKRTRLFERADPAERAALAEAAWGPS